MTRSCAIFIPTGERALDEITNEEEALAAVRQDGRALYIVPKNLVTAELCFEAVRQDGDAFLFVPKSLEVEVLRAHRNVREK